MPLLHERAVPENSEPILSSNPDGDFVQVRQSKVTGMARCAMFKCPLDGEDRVVTSLVKALEGLGCVKLVHTLAEARDILGQKAKTVVYELPVENTGLRYVKGPPGPGILMVHPNDVGGYIRVGDYLGVMLLAVDRTLVLFNGVA